MATWQTERHRQRHFVEHGAEMGYSTIEEYDAGADDTLAVGRYFRYWDDNTGLDRIGCFDVHTGRFVVTNEEDEIVSYFLTDERYVRGLPYSEYDDGEDE
jgi:hypothetical protein